MRGQDSASFTCLGASCPGCSTCDPLRPTPSAAPKAKLLLNVWHDFVAEVAAMNYDGEERADQDDGIFVMENDDAVETLSRLIHDAREILALEVGTR